MMFKRTALVLALAPLFPLAANAQESQPPRAETVAAVKSSPETLAVEKTAPAIKPSEVIVAPAIVEPAKELAKPATVEPKESAEPAAKVDADVGGLVSEKEVIVVSSPTIEPPPSDLWDRMRAGFTMADLDDQYVRKWEQFYAGKPDYLDRITARGSKYMFYIVTEIERRGMPLEIALLPVIESAFVTHANSSAAAAGIWQFIPSTGKNFGMKQDWWADSRRDIVKATQGALDYLQKLHGMFGDWHLALASYNWGEGAVGRAVAANQAAGKGTDYASLNMPVETRNYLPKLQAVKNIVLNPGAFNVRLASIPNQPYFKTITLSHHIDVDKTVKMAEITKDEFIALNPAHNRPVIGGRDEHQILLPADKADLFLSRLDVNDKALVSWMAYKTKAGDRLDALASRFGTSADALRAVNGIRSSPASLPAGYHLLVPSSGPSEEALGSLQNAVFTKLPEYAPQVAMPKIHRAGQGETLASVAKRYGVSVQKLAQWNHLGSKASISRGALLAVSGPMPMTTRLVKVKRGGKFVMVKQSVPAVRVAATKGGKSKFVLVKKSSGKKYAKKASRRRV